MGNMTRNGWRSARLGSLAQINPEQLGEHTDPDYVMKYLDIATVDRPDAISSARKMVFAEAPTRARRRIRKGDILVSTVRPYLRNFTRIKEAPNNLIASTGYAVVRPADGVDGRFLYQHILSDAFIRFLVPRMTGSNYPAVRPRDVEAYELLVPPLLEQRKIATILSSVDDAIEDCRRVIEQIRVVKRGLMQQLLAQGLPERHSLFKQTEIGCIPSEWSVVRIREVGLVEAGRQRSPKARGRLRPYLRVANVYDGHIETEGVMSMPFSDAEFTHYRLMPGDLLLNEGQSRELVGRCAQYSGEPPDCCFQNTLIRFRAGQRIEARFAFWTFRQYFYSGIFSAVARQTTSVAHLGVSRFGHLKIALPSLSEQAEIVRHIEASSIREDMERRWLERLRVLKSALMPILLNSGSLVCNMGRQR